MANKRKKVQEYTEPTVISISGYAIRVERAIKNERKHKDETRAVKEERVNMETDDR
jgi:hypothetical protein